MARSANSRTPNTGQRDDASRSDSQSGARDDDEADAGKPDDTPKSVRSLVEVRPTRVLGALVGALATPAADQTDIGFYATDLGRSTAHKNSLRLLFGDTWRDERGTAIDSTYDDVQGDISLVDFPDGPSVDAYIEAHPARADQLPWQAAAPPVKFLTRDGRVAPLMPYRSGQAQSMGLGRTPVAVWSDGGEGLFAIFNRIQPLACADAEPRCPNDFECDSGLGGAFGLAGEGIMPCVIGEEVGCSPVASRGFCQDRTSSTYDAADVAARKLSVVYQEELGNEDLEQPGRYLTTAFNTNKFINPCARTVADFDPTRKDGAGNVYTPATGGGSRETLFIWGRPWFSGARGRDVRLYLQVLDLPRYSATGEWDLRPQFFTGVQDGVPQFSDREVDAKPLDLSGPPSDPTVEESDIAGELSVSWVEPLKRWVMLSGAEYSPGALTLMQGSPAAAGDVKADPEGGIFVRFSDQPWGPWSAPQHILRAHLADGSIAPLDSAPTNLLARPDCTTSDCPPRERAFSPSERGGFYSAHAIEPWTTTRDYGADLYWVVSTWNPYQVVLLKTELHRR